MMKSWLVILALIFSIVPTANAVSPDEVLSDPALEARARALSKELRCLVCQNQSIDDSDAQLAKDLRVLVRERLVAGDDDAQVVNFIVDRYGEYVLLKPRIAFHTIFLWATPFVVLLIGLIFLWSRGVKKSQTVTQTALSADEEKALSKLLDSEK